jgi:hypothetical protein
MILELNETINHWKYCFTFSRLLAQNDAAFKMYQVILDGIHYFEKIMYIQT